MAKSLTISIDNKDYNVIGENAEIIKLSAKLLNEKIEEIAKNRENIPSLTKTTLAALNIADMEINNEIKHSNELQRVMEEIKKITEYIETNINFISINLL
jgi:cell division protein ZapA (FtsZ GTPase activity inhibitor)